jgi:diguanylate cyclase (GGDEF)-like protein
LIGFPAPRGGNTGDSAGGTLSDRSARRQVTVVIGVIGGALSGLSGTRPDLKPRRGGVDTSAMAQAQERAPAWAKLGIAMMLGSLALLSAHDAFGARWHGLVSNGFWNWSYNAVEMIAVAVCASRALVRRRERGAWLAITLGMGLFAAGDVYYTVFFDGASNVPFPSWADALYLSYYPPVYVGIGLLLRSRVRELSKVLWLDGLIAGLAVAAIGAALAFGAILSQTHGAPLTVATNLAYPLGDLVLLGLIVGIIAITGWRTQLDWWLIAVGLVIFGVTDSLYLLQTANNTYVQGGLLDLGWPGPMVIVGCAAWLRPRAGRPPRLEGWGMFAVPVVAAVACLGLEFYDHYHRITFIAHGLATACLLTVIVRLVMSFSENLRMLRASRAEAVTDALTGLGNRRALKLELESRLAQLPVEPFVLAFYDLDGFKIYNDTFGHQAGDALLTRLGRRIAESLPEAGVFRMGGDEFCVIVSMADGGFGTVKRGAEALSERGSSFSVSCSFGTVEVPVEALDADTAMLLADTRMYEHKDDRRPSAASESQGVLLRALAERNNELGEHHNVVADLVEAVARELGLANEQVVPIRRAAELHDVGKLAIPDAILNKPGPLSDEEWVFMRGHTIVGERIVSSASSLRNVAPMVRSSHERWDGGGYPDGLAGANIPLGARIIAVCDAYDAMVTTRAYRAARTSDEAIAELRRCAGKQFDSEVVDAFERVLADREDIPSSESVAA